MKRSSFQTQKVVLYLFALGLFSLCVLAVAAYRGKISAQISDDVGDAGQLRFYAVQIYIKQKEPDSSVTAQSQLNKMGEEIKRLLVRYPGSSDELISAWREFYAKAVAKKLTPQDTQSMADASRQFLSEIRERGEDEAENGYWMLVYGALGLVLLVIRGFILVREVGRAEVELRNSERRFAILAEASLDGIAISENGIIQDVNSQFVRLLGYKPEEVIGHHLTDFAVLEDVERAKEYIHNKQEVTYEVVCVRKDKSTFPVEITARTLQFPNREMRLTVARDITQIKQLEMNWQEANKSLAISNERWRTLATLDSLTGAYTRRALHLTLVREIRRAGHSGLSFSVIMLDINGFKKYNDAYGHVGGDEVLRRVVEILRQALRDVDVIARYGGDEFVIVLVDTGALEANAVARRCYHAIEEETGFKRKMSASMGVITCFVETETSVHKDFCLELVENILERADRALYQSKTKEKEHITIADNLRINKDFIIKKSPGIPAPKIVEDDIVDDLVDDLVI